MKNLFYFAVCAFVLSSCGATKSASTAPSPNGNWDYVISSTPYGDLKGVLTVSEVDKAYTAKMVTNDGEIIMSKFTYDKETMKMSGNFDYEGTPVDFNAAFAGNEITGTMAAGGGEFPFKGVRKN